MILNRQHLRLILPLLFIGLSMCSKDRELDVDEGKQEDFVYSPDRAIRYNGQYLEFSSPQVLENTIQKYRDGNADELEKWIKLIGFASMQKIFQQAQKEQNQVISTMVLKYQDKDIAGMDRPLIELNKSVMANPEKFVVSDEGILTGLTIFHPDYANLVNLDGILKVGGHLFQYTDKSLKILIGGDKSNISLLKGATQSNTDAGIVVNVVKPQSKGSASGRYNYSHSIEETFDRSYNALRIKGDINIQLFSSPIYGPMQCDGGCGDLPIPEQTAKAFSPECYCYYPITGYNYRTLYTTHMEVLVHQIFWWRAYHVWSSDLYAHYSINGVPQPGKYAYGIEVSNTYLTVYDGPMANISSVDNQYQCTDIAGKATTKYKAYDSFAD